MAIAWSFAFFFPVALTVTLTALLLAGVGADATFLIFSSKLFLELDLEVDVIASLETTCKADFDAFLLLMLGSELAKELIVQILCSLDKFVHLFHRQLRSTRSMLLLLRRAT